MSAMTHSMTVTEDELKYLSNLSFKSNDMEI